MYRPYTYLIVNPYIIFHFTITNRLLIKTSIYKINNYLLPTVNYPSTDSDLLSKLYNTTKH